MGESGWTTRGALLRAAAYSQDSYDTWPSLPEKDHLDLHKDANAWHTTAIQPPAVALREVSVCALASTQQYPLQAPMEAARCPFPRWPLVLSPLV